MKALVDLAVGVDGVQYSVPAGREVPAALVEYWTAHNLLSRLRASCAIEAEPVAEASKKTYKSKGSK